MTPEEIGSRMAALLGAGDAASDVEPTAEAAPPSGAAVAATAEVRPETGPLDAPAAADAADAVSAREREVSQTPRTDTAGGPTIVAGSAARPDPTPAPDAEGERAARIARAQEARAARAAAAGGGEAGGDAAGDERAARIARAQEARAARAAAAGGGEAGGAGGAGAAGGDAAGDERAARIARAQEARAARAAAAGGEAGGAGGAGAAGGDAAGDERAARIARAQEARAARGPRAGRPGAASAAPAQTAVRTVGGIGLSVTGGGAFGRATVDVPAATWAQAVAKARDDEELACDFFDWLSAVDELDEGFTVVAHVWSTTRRHGLLIRTRVGRDAPVLDTITAIYPGAAWHERETHEMFGIGFAGHADLKPLLLPPEFEGHPLRKDFVLASRVAKAWPGAKEPGESESGAAKRAPMRPPGVPAPGEWGPA